MKKFVLVLLLLPVVVSAREVLVTTVLEPYEVIEVTSPVTESQLHLGELDNFPIMYEFIVSEPITFRANLEQPTPGGSNPVNPLTLMLVRKDDRGGGVTEVTRLNNAPADWTPYKDSVLGVTLLQGGEIDREIDAGVYRLEVSTPDNFGKYLLSFGPSDRGGYFASLQEVWRVQQFLGYSPLRILTSSLVYYPLGILLVGFLIHRTWKYRKLISHAS